jgi:hypothetical protein
VDDTTDIQQTIFTEVAQVAPAGWTTAEIAYRRAGKTAEHVLVIHLADGTTTSPGVQGFAFSKAMKELRKRTYQRDRGAWFTATVTLSAQGRLSMDLDYDGEPAWLTPVVAGTYAEEQEQYPRDADHQPAWYAAKLQEAGAA